jgi:type IV pilus assembly protein PilB
MKDYWQRRSGELLVEEGIVSPEEVEHALKVQIERGGRLCSVLIELGYLDERELVSFLSRKFKMPHLDLSDLDLDVEVIKYVSPEFAKENQVVPVDRVGGMLTVAVVYPLDTVDLRHIEDVSRLSVKQIAATRSDVLKVIRAYYEMTLPGAVS